MSPSYTPGPLLVYLGGEIVNVVFDEKNIQPINVKSLQTIIYNSYKAIHIWGY